MKYKRITLTIQSKYQKGQSKIGDLPEIWHIKLPDIFSRIIEYTSFLRE